LRLSIGLEHPDDLIDDLEARAVRDIGEFFDLRRHGMILEDGSRW
jgi:hypothetical protein